MKKNRLRYIILSVIAGFALSGCGPSPEEAIEQLKEMGYTYNEVGFVRALDENNPRAYLRFLLADKSRILKKAAFLLAGCEDRPYERVQECLDHLTMLKEDYGVDFGSLRDQNRYSMLWYAGKAGNKAVAEFLIRMRVPLGNHDTLTRLARLNSNDFKPDRRQRRIELIPQMEYLISLYPDEKKDETEESEENKE